MRLLIHPSASKDTEEAALWYNKQRQGLGLDFLLSVEAAINSIYRNPYHFALVKKNYRRVTIQRFPFGIFYTVENNLIIVLAVWHHKRKPFGWQKR